MISNKVYTQQEITELINKLKEIFPVVRILKEKQIHGEVNLDGIIENKCFNFWGKCIPCENCISSKTLKDHKDRTKIEYKDGKPYQVYSFYVNVEGSNNVLEVLKDIDHLSIDPDDVRILSSQLLHLNDEVYRDTLTGTFNRAYYDDRKDKLINQATTGIAFIDIDDFKSVNDIYGHNFGDTVLKEIANVLMNNIGRYDSVLRYGGDEFILLSPKVNKQSFYTKLEGIRKQISDIVFHQHDKLHVTVSIGAEIIEKDSCSLEEAVKKADKLMLAAKANRNYVMASWMNYDHLRHDINDEYKLYVLIVEDSDLNRELLTSMLEDKYRILTASDGLEALKLVNDYRQNISLILLDIEMPNMGGFEFLNEFKLTGMSETIPVIMISGNDNPDVIVHAFDLGAVDYISKPFNVRILSQRVENIIKLFLRQRRFKSEIRRQIDRTHSVSRMTTIILSHIIGYRNHESESHLIHVEEITKILLDALSTLDESYIFSEEEKNNIIAASSMHDIGKLGIPEEILNKPDKLTSEEYEIMKTHTLIGAEMLHSLTQYQEEPLVRYAYNIARWHHEKYDGNGYPDHLVGDDIPIEAQIVSIADVYDALVSKRVYKEGYDKNIALQMILNGECGQFNPLLLECLKVSIDKIQKIY